MYFLKSIGLVFLALFSLSTFAGPISNMKIDNVTGNPDGSYNFDWSYTYSSSCAETDVDLDTEPSTITYNAAAIKSYSGNLQEPQPVVDISPPHSITVGGSSHGWSIGVSYTVKIHVGSVKTSSPQPAMNWDTYGFMRKSGMTCQQSGSVPVPPIPTLASCTATSSTANVDLGQWFLSDLPQIGATTQAKAVPITLNCTGGSNGSSVSATITAQGDSADPTHYIALTGGGAKGMAIQLLDHSNTVLPLNQKFTVLSSFGTGTYPLNWSARYIRTSSTITEGEADSVITAVFSYE